MGFSCVSAVLVLHLLAFLNHSVSHGMGVCVTEADMDRSEAFLSGEVGSAVVKRDARCTRIAAMNLEIDPIKTRADAEMEGFGKGFFGSESGSVAAKLGRCRERFAVGNLACRIDAISEAITVSREASLDAGDLDEVGADTVDGHFLSRVSVHEFAHFGHGVMEANGERTRYQVMPDVKLGQIRDLIKIRDV
jgi:hypothetical protein